MAVLLYLNWLYTSVPITWGISETVQLPLRLWEKPWNHSPPGAEAGPPLPGAALAVSAQETAGTSLAAGVAGSEEESVGKTCEI